MIRLKQSTASQEIPLGIFVDSTDGDTEEAGLTISNTDIKLWKMGATTLASKNSGGATYISNGIYYCVLDATDTNTLGAMIVFVHVAGALAVRVECEVLTANVYDSLIGGTDTLDVQVTGIATDAVNATALAADAVSEIQSGLSTLNAAGIRTAVGLASANLDTQLDALPTAAENADAVWDEAIAGHLGAGSTGLALNSAGSAGDPWNTALPGAYGAGTAGKIVGDNVNATISSRAVAGDAMALTGGERTTLAGVIWGSVMEGSRTAIQYMRGFGSALLAKASGMATTTAVFRDVDDSKPRITATVDADGNRSAITLDLT